MQPKGHDPSSFSQTIKLSDLPFPVTPFPATLAEIAQPVGAIVAALEVELRKIAKREERVKSGRIFTTRDGADGSVSLDAGWRAGCIVNVRRKMNTPDELTLSLHVLARLTRWLQWGSFALLPILSLFVGKRFLYLKGEAIEFLVLLFAGLLAGVGVMVLIARMQVGTDRAASAEAAARVRGAIASWLERLEGTATS